MRGGVFPWCVVCVVCMVCVCEGHDACVVSLI
jgi:hypothetical protein